ncbi:MAG: hypothetical protein ABWX68_13040 [Arthrobacter sp.]|uniref:hypothetical protein n=1 Tax=Arthrobacter sp. TaxID=1667 RepID=UPI003476BD50
MPSFRAQLNIVGLRPGNPPEAVMDAAVASVGGHHHVESHQLDIVGGVPRITLRFTVQEEDRDAGLRRARRAAVLMRDTVETVAVTERLVVLRRDRGRWAPL